MGLFWVIITPLWRRLLRDTVDVENHPINCSGLRVA